MTDQASGSEAAAAQPSDTASDYLMTIRYMLGEGSPVIAARVAERMGVSPATTSEMVSRLSREGMLVVDEATRQLELTDAGRAVAERTFRRHALAEWLLTEVIGLGWAEADEEAHHLQHALSERVTDRIDDLLGAPPTCPHGNPIPRAGETPDRPAGIPLAEAAAGAEVTILRVTEEAEEDARLLTFLEEHDVRPGRILEVREVADHIGTMSLAGPGGEVTLGLTAAAKLRVLPGRADPKLFHRVPDRARLAASVSSAAG